MQRLVIAPEQKQDQQILLNPKQQHYLRRVLRLQAGDRFIAIDGQGNWWLSQLAEAGATILQSIAAATELSVAVTLLVALPKTGFDEVVRQGTELGVSCIVPVTSARSLLQPSSHKLERWRRIAQEAAEQSERQLVPSILDPMPLEAALQFASSHCAFICEARGDRPHLLSCLNQISQESAQIAIAIGAEGGWTAAELLQAEELGYQPVSLGRRIFRAVTAPLVALSIVAAVWEVT